MTGHEAQQILDALSRVESQLHARIDALDREMTESVNGMRDRHHDAMNELSGQMARTSVDLARFTGELQSHIRLTDTAITAISKALETHTQAPGHEATVRWQEKMTGRAVGFGLGITMGAGITGSGLTLLIDRLLG